MKNINYEVIRVVEKMREDMARKIATATGEVVSDVDNNWQRPVWPNTGNFWHKDPTIDINNMVSLHVVKWDKPITNRRHINSEVRWAMVLVYGLRMA